MSSKIAKRIENEFKNLVSVPICDAKIEKENGNIYKWKVLLPGLKGSTYDDGLFNLSFNLENYPFRCPEVKFITPIYHPNIKKDTGEICMEDFANNQAPTEKISDIIKKIASLLLYPLIEFPLEPEIAYEFSTNYSEWEKKVREFIKYGDK